MAAKKIRQAVVQAHVASKPVGADKAEDYLKVRAEISPVNLMQAAPAPALAQQLLVTPGAKRSSAMPQAGVNTPAFDRLELIQTFVRIVEAGSMSAAAKLLATSQPTISRRLKSLEQYLGLQLLQRSTHQLVLTPDGERSFERFRTLLATWGAMESEIRGARDEPVGHLRVLAPHAFGQDRLIGPLADYLARYPRMSLEWNLHDDRSLHDFIAEGIDCAIQVGNLRDVNLVARHLGDIPRILIAAPNFIPASLNLQHPRQLADLPWIALTTFYQNEVEFVHQQTAERVKVEFQTRMRTDNLYALRNAVRHGIGIGVGSSWVMQEDLAQGQLVHLLPQWQVASLPVSLIYPYAPFYPAKLRCFIELMKQVLPQIFGAVDQAGPA